MGRRHYLHLGSSKNEFRRTINRVLNGRLNVSGRFFMEANKTKTWVPLASVTTTTVIVVSPESADASASTEFYLEPSDGGFWVHHSPRSQATGPFGFAAFGG